MLFEPIYLHPVPWFIFIHLIPLCFYYHFLLYSLKFSPQNKFISYISPVFFLYWLVNPYYFQCNYLLNMMFSGSNCMWIMKLYYALYLNNSISLDFHHPLNPFINNNLINKNSDRNHTRGFNTSGSPSFISFSRFIMFMCTTIASSSHRKYILAEQNIKNSKHLTNSSENNKFIEKNQEIVNKFHTQQPSLLLSPSQSALRRVIEILIHWIIFQFVFNAYSYFNTRPHLREESILINYLFYYLMGLNFYIFILLFCYVVWAVFEYCFQIHLPSVMYQPYLATSPRDFWSTRWNRLFRDLFHDCCFSSSYIRNILPAPVLTLFAFAISAALHEWGIRIAFGNQYAQWENLLFFLLHCGITIAHVLFTRAFPKFCNQFPRPLAIILNNILYCLTAPLFFGPYERLNVMEILRPLLLWEMI